MQNDTFLPAPADQGLLRSRPTRDEGVGFRMLAGGRMAAILLAFGAAWTGAAQSLAWNSVYQKQDAKLGATNVHFVFNLTNTSAASDVLITAVRPSCGCTTAKVPPLPWRLDPGVAGQIEATVDIHDKRGTVSKVITVESSAGTNLLTLVITIPEDRSRNMALAKADRQAVFRGDCASCHVQPTVGQTGAALFHAACGICHESDHRATMVPNLTALKKPTGREYWDTWVRHGKAGSLMPAFAKAEGGPLDEDQIRSLVDYLTTPLDAPAATRAAAP
jgi:mono/diheme cytochrome c family protein